MAGLRRRQIRKAIMAETGWRVESHVDGTIDVWPPSNIAEEAARDRIRELVRQLGDQPRFLGVSGGNNRVPIRFDTPGTLAEYGRGSHGYAG